MEVLVTCDICNTPVPGSIWIKHEAGCVSRQQLFVSQEILRVLKDHSDLLKSLDYELERISDRLKDIYHSI